MQILSNHVIQGGGQHVNPAVTVSMWALDKCSYTEGFVRIAGQMGGGLVAFPLFHYISEVANLTPFGGPEFSEDTHAEAFISEFISSFLLMWAIYIVSETKKSSCRDLEKKHGFGIIYAVLTSFPLRHNASNHQF